MGKVSINGHWHQIQYERFHILYGKCGSYGHYTRQCVTDSPQIHNSIVSRQQKEQSKVDGRREQVMSEQGVELTQKREEEVAVLTSETHGDWLVVTKKERNQNQPRAGKSLRDNLEKVSNLCKEGNHFLD